MKYSEFKYVRPDTEKTLKEFELLIDDFEKANSMDAGVEVLMKINALWDNINTMRSIANINYSINTLDKSFEEEREFFDESIPLFEDTNILFNKILLKSKFKDKLTEKYGKHFFDIAEATVRSFDHKIVEEMQKENHLCSEYVKLKAGAKIFFEGKERNLQDMEPFMESTDRDTRRNAFHAYWKFYSDNAGELNETYDRLVKLRNEMGLKMGYKNFIELGYARMQRIDYTEEMVDKFRENIKKFVVPVSMKLRERQRKRLGLDKLMVYDLFTQFTTGNAKPKGNPDWILKKGKQMYDEFSESTSVFYNYMLDNELMDVESRKGKDTGGFCDYIPLYKSPFIFSNMNGTHGDITVLTHEAGHAYQAFECRDMELSVYRSPSSDACEIHSMSMEFLTHPWMNLFFEGDTDKFKFEHLMECISFLPYGVLVDHFQHWIYKNPEATPTERNLQWRELEKVYMPHLNYGDIEFLEKGGRWQKQSHIYEMPFYYIDYCLAQVCAFQFWSKAIHNNKNGEYKNEVLRYIDLCKKGGSEPFLGLVKYAGLDSPFDESVIKKLVDELDEYLDGIDDKKL